uniref:Uncharacterized protein n=1 Tax=Amphimedon queenslandica TaxID=400682 RepID=A0A1X7T8P4_AMPQE
MESAGIDTSEFKTHSVRSASTSAACMQEVTTEDILSAVDWNTESSFHRFFISLANVARAYIESKSPTHRWSETMAQKLKMKCYLCGKTGVSNMTVYSTWDKKAKGFVEKHLEETPPPNATI